MMTLYAFFFLSGLFINYGTIELSAVLFGYTLPSLCINYSTLNLKSAYAKQKTNVETFLKLFIFGVILSRIRIISFIVCFLLGWFLQQNKKHVMNLLQNLDVFITTQCEQNIKIKCAYTLWKETVLLYLSKIDLIINGKPTVNEPAEEPAEEPTEEPDRKSDSSYEKITEDLDIKKNE